MSAEPLWAELLHAQSTESAQAWLKTELMIAFHRQLLSTTTIEEMFSHFGLRSA